MRKYYYRDINETTPQTEPDLFDVRSILQNVVNLITTRKGTRAFENIEWGVDIEDELFDLMDSGAELRIFNAIVDALNQFEPRVSLDQGKSNVIADSANHEFKLDLYFEIEGFDDKLFNVSETLRR